VREYSNNNKRDSGEVNRRAEYPVRTIVAKSAREALRPEMGTPPPPRRSRASRNQFVVFLNFVVSSIVFLLVIAGIALYLGKRTFDGPGPSDTTETVLIRPNTGLREIADMLERQGLISDSRIFLLGV